CTGRIAVVECGSGELVAALTGAGLDAYGVEPRAAIADEALQRGLEVRVDSSTAHLQAVAPGALEGIVLRALVERLPLGELLTLIDTAAARLAPGGRLVVCSLQRDAWGRDATAAEADLVPGHPLLGQTWVTLLGEQGFHDVRACEAGADAFVVDALRSSE